MAKAKNGRRKPNPPVNEAKAAILDAFEKLGGVDRLVEWIREDKANEASFWIRIFPKLLPRPPIEAPPPPEELPPVKGALVWRVPAWAKAAQRQSRLKSEARTDARKARPPAKTPEQKLAEIPTGWDDDY